LIKVIATCPCQSALHRAPVESSFLKQLGSNRGTSVDPSPWAKNAINKPNLPQQLIPSVGFQEGIAK